MNRIRVRPWMLVSAVWIGPGVLSVFSQIAQRSLQGEPAPGARQLLWAAGDWIVYAILTPFIFWAAERWPVERPVIAARVLLHLALSTLLSVCWAVSGKLLDLLLFAVFEPGHITSGFRSAGDDLVLIVLKDVTSWVLTTLPFGLVVYLSVLGIAHGIRFYARAREQDVLNARLAEQLSGARYAALQSQVNPHFLFNTLNTVAVLVRDGDREGAVRIVEQMSDVLRRTLHRHHANEVTLQEELELVQQYLAIEQARFSDRLRPTIDVPTDLFAALVPGFAVQHLVENAIRHGIARRTEAGKLDVVARRDGDMLVVTVADDGAGFSDATSFDTGHGIDNTRERLRVLYGDGASLDVQTADIGVVATLRVPWRVMASTT